MNKRREYNYRGMATQKIIESKNNLEELVGRYREDTMLEILKSEIVNSLEFNDTCLNSWFRDGIEEDWDTLTIAEGKAACIGNINALEMLTKGIKAILDKKEAEKRERLVEYQLRLEALRPDLKAAKAAHRKGLRGPMSDAVIREAEGLEKEIRKLQWGA